MLELPTKNELTELLSYLTPHERAELDSLLTQIFYSDPVDWIQAEFYIPETGAPIQLEPYQQRVIREALRKDSEGFFVYSTVLYSDLKKSAKSTIAAAVALYMAWHTPWESVRIVANDLKQADSRTFRYIERAIMLNPRLRDQCKVNNYRIDLPNHTVIEAVPVDPKGEAGGGDLIVCFTELWAYKNTAARQMWTETTLSPLKRGKSMRWCESYAGYTGESPILEQLHQMGVIDGARIDDDLELFANGDLLAFWNTTPRCPWQTPDYYASEARVLTESEFRRIHRNEFVSSEEAFIPLAWWDACRADAPAIATDEQWVVALDAAVTSDSFGIVGVVREGEIVRKRYCREWKPPKGGYIDFSEPEAEIRRLASEHNIVCFTYDPYQLHDLCTRLQREGIGWFKPFSQGSERLKADKELYDTVRDRRFLHDGDPVLTAHVANANAKTEGDKLRIVKRAEHLKIDLVVALSMASYVARYLNLG